MFCISYLNSIHRADLVTCANEGILLLHEQHNIAVASVQIHLDLLHLLHFHECIGILAILFQLLSFVLQFLNVPLVHFLLRLGQFDVVPDLLQRGHL